MFFLFLFYRLCYWLTSIVKPFGFQYLLVLADVKSLLTTNCNPQLLISLVAKVIISHGRLSESKFFFEKNIKPHTVHLIIFKTIDGEVKCREREEKKNESCY